MSVLAGFGNFVALEGLVTPGDPTQTARDILESDGLFRLVYAAVYLVAISQLVGVLRLVGDVDYLAVFSRDQRQSQALLGINSVDDVWRAGRRLAMGGASLHATTTRR